MTPIPPLRPQQDKKPTRVEVNQHAPQKPESRRGKKKAQRAKYPRWRKVLRIIGIISVNLAALGAIVAIAGVAYISRDLPDPTKLNDRNLAESTKIYDRTGEHVLYTVSGDQYREIIPLSDIPEAVKQATILLEDRDFYQHKGFNLVGFVRAAFANVVTGDKSQGGSTITQQFVKNSILTKEKSYTRKIKELILSIQIERKFSKDEILQLYFNEIPYGSTAYGIEAASQLYYGKSAKELDLAQSAIIASLPQRPSVFLNNQELLKTRQEYALDLMAEAGHITKEQAEAAKKEDVKITPRTGQITAPHFVFYVRELLEDRYGEAALAKGGLKVITTLDYDKQKIAEDAVSNGMQKIEQYGGSNAALVSLDTKTGQILAMVGSKDYFDKTIDGQVNITTSLQQPGSSFKPIVYASAFEKGYTPDTILFDVKTTFKTGGADWSPNNYDFSERGPMTAKKALAGSLNIPTAQVTYLSGPDNVVSFARKLGYTTLKGDYDLAVGLGVAEVKMVEHAAAYAAFAREGLYNPPVALLRVEDKNGKVLDAYKEATTRVYDEKVGRMINNILSDDSLRAYVFGRGSKLTLKGREVAAKTGTTQDFQDAWTMGYTPSVVTAVWAGNNNNKLMKRGADGSVVAAPIWNEYMTKVTAGSPAETFKKPDLIKTNKPILNGEIDVMIPRVVDRITGNIIPDECLNNFPEDMRTTKEFKETHTVLYYVQKDDPLGDPPKKPEDDVQFAGWEAAAQKWAKGQPGYLTGDTKKEDCNLRSANNFPSVSIAEPTSGAVFTSQNIPVSVSATGQNGKTINRVELFLDGQRVATLTSAPFTTTITTSNANGTYTLTAKAFDSVENSSSASVDISIQVPTQEVLN